MNTIANAPPESQTRKQLDETQRAAPVDLAEATASLRVLVYLAKADGELTAEDKRVLHDTLAGELHPSAETLEYLADEKVDLDNELHKIKSNEARERTYNGAYCLAHMDGECSPAKANLLEHIREGLSISSEKSTLLGQIYSEARETVWPQHINPLADAAAREAKINDEILKYSSFNAVTGAFPLPGLSVATDLIVISVQTKLVRDIGQYWGHKVDRQAARSLIGAIAGATGLRIAVHTLLNIVPVLGSVVGATSSFVSTWALGRVADRYFESGGKLSSAELRKLFHESMDEAKAAYEKSKATISHKMELREKALRLLDEDLKAGRITQEQYAKAIKAFE